jgi:hypothetical protein
MGAGYTTVLDVANRVMQHLGAASILSLDEVSKNAGEFERAYDKDRLAELRRNFWTFATFQTVLRAVDSTTLLIVPDAWSTLLGYASGSIVSHDGQLWWTTETANVGEEPGVSDAWQSYFGPLTASAYDDETKYWASELVYLTDDYGRTTVFASRINNNMAEPSAPDEWDAEVAYATGAVVQATDGFYYMNLVPVNLNHDPLDSPAPFNASTTYAAGDTVGGIDGKIYTSVQGSNAGHEPTTDNGTWWTTDDRLWLWSSAFSQPITGSVWVAQRATLKNLNLGYPIGTGPLSVPAQRYIFRLPNGFLRTAPQSPKQGDYAFLGAPSAPNLNDWIFQGNYLITNYPQPLNIRFIANVTNIPRMDPMFLEGLSARIALNMCEVITQSNTKKAALGQFYTEYMREARLVNAIEAGEIQPPEDLYITVRY